MAATKSIETLVQDVYSLLEQGIELTDEQTALLGTELAQAIRGQIKPRTERKSSSLYFSALGKPDRQLWYEYNKVKGEPLHPSDKFKFLYGTLIEILMLNLARWSGHEVTEVQGRALLDGVSGYKDCRIDGVTVDIKSASTFSFEKFKDGSLFEKDPFGYLAQITGYIKAGSPDKPETGAFWAADKQHGHLTLLPVPPSRQPDVLKMIEHKKKVVILEEPPERCYKPEPMGKSGNEVLPVGCSYCAFKQTCWADANNGVGLRTFLYSTGPKFFTKVMEEPRVNEIGNNATKKNKTSQGKTDEL